MIITEYLKTREDGVVLKRSFSSLGMMIKQRETDILYNEAIDIEGSDYSYLETEIPIDSEEEGS